MEKFIMGNPVGPMESQQSSQEAGGKVSGKRCEGGGKRRCYMSGSDEEERGISHGRQMAPSRWKSKGHRFSQSLLKMPPLLPYGFRDHGTDLNI